MEANTSVPVPFEDICLDLCQLAYVMAERACSLSSMLLYGTFRNQAEGCHSEHTKSEAHSATWHSEEVTAHLLYS